MRHWREPVYRWLALLVSAAFMWLSCAPTRNLTVPEVRPYYSIKIFTTDNRVLEGLVTERSGAEIVLINETDHKTYRIPLKDIRRVERSTKIYDYEAYPISEAEIQKYKDNHNAWGYAVGGAVVSGLVGLVAALPFWYADVGGIPPYFVAGVSAVAGSIFFTMKGIEKDREIAVEKVRYIHHRERELEKQKQEELRRLQEIQKKKQELLKKLEEKKKKQKQQNEVQE